MALIEPGDEVVLFQPMYDAYVPLVQRAGGVPRFVKWSRRTGASTRKKLARAFTPRTRVVLFNNPLNPSATVFRREDLELLARYCEKFNAVAVCDEVWEHVMFDGRRHVPLIAMPGMRERCVKIGSAGKIFRSPAGRSGSSAPRRNSAARAGQGAPVHQPSRRRRTCSRGRLRSRQDRRYFSQGCAPTCSAAATRFTRACARSASR